MFDDTQDPPLVALNQFCRAIGISAITAWRFRRRGWLETVNIAGRQYLTAAAIANFTRRAEAGDFSQVHAVPGRARNKVAARATRRPRKS